MIGFLESEEQRKGYVLERQHTGGLLSSQTHIVHDKMELQERFVIKYYSKNHLQRFGVDYEQVLSTLKGYQNVQHPNLAKMLEIIENPRDQEFITISEFISDLDLQKVILSNSKSKLREENICKLLADVSTAMLYLQNQKTGYIHHNLKLTNIIKNEQTNQFMVSDYQFGHIYKEKRIYLLGFSSPQVILKEPYTCLCDIWCFGTIIYMFYFDEIPFLGSSKEDKIQQIKQRTQSRQDLQLPISKTKTEMARLIFAMLEYQEQERISWTKLKDEIKNVEQMDFRSPIEYPPQNKTEIEKSLFKSRAKFSRVQNLESIEKFENFQSSLMKSKAQFEQSTLKLRHWEQNNQLREEDQKFKNYFISQFKRLEYMHSQLILASSYFSELQVDEEHLNKYGLCLQELYCMIKTKYLLVQDYLFQTTIPDTFRNNSHSYSQFLASQSDLVQQLRQIKTEDQIQEKFLENNFEIKKIGIKADNYEKFSSKFRDDYYQVISILVKEKTEKHILRNYYELLMIAEETNFFDRILFDIQQFQGLISTLDVEDIKNQINFIKENFADNI